MMNLREAPSATAIESPAARMGSMARILVVDRNASLLASLRETLEQERHTVTSARTAEEGIQAVREQNPDLIIVDPVLPDLHGFEVCRALRQETLAPIIIVTDNQEEMDKIVALELGADDYLTKPFGMKELVARIGARLRRAGREFVSQAPTQAIIAGDLRLDLTRRELTKDGQVVILRLKEFELLSVLMQHRGRTFSRSELLRRIWGYDAYGRSRTVDVHIDRLRGKIEDDPARPRRIVTMRGVGYRFEAEG